MHFVTLSSQYSLKFFEEIKVGINTLMIQNGKLHFKFSLTDK